MAATWAPTPEAPAEDQVALRGNHRYLARLTPLPDGPDGPAPAARVAGDVLDAAGLASAGEAAGGQPVRLINPALGTLDSLQWARARRRPPGPGEVEIAVSAVGVNLKDVLLALGLDMGQEPGSFEPGRECSGRVVTLGDGVTGLAPGDAVMAIANPCYGSYLTVDADLVMPVPAGWSLEEAAGFPIAYGTAYYSLVQMARLSAGERVLIHAAAGGVGLAAVRIAQALGAEVFATAGSPDKREFLRAAGVQHRLDSRSLKFAEQVMALTGGQGVDVVLNSLAGTAMEWSLDTLGSFGRFVEIGVRDIYEHNRRIGLRHFRKSQSFIAVDLNLLTDERPVATKTLILETTSFAASHGLGPLPHRPPYRKAGHRAGGIAGAGRTAARSGDQFPGGRNVPDHRGARRGRPGRGAMAGRPRRTAPGAGRPTPGCRPEPAGHHGTARAGRDSGGGRSGCHRPGAGPRDGAHDQAGHATAARSVPRRSGAG